MEKITAQKPENTWNKALFIIICYAVVLIYIFGVCKLAGGKNLSTEKTIISEVENNDR